MVHLGYIHQGGMLGMVHPWYILQGGVYAQYAPKGVPQGGIYASLPTSRVPWWVYSLPTIPPGYHGGYTASLPCYTCTPLGIPACYRPIPYCQCGTGCRAVAGRGGPGL